MARHTLKAFLIQVERLVNKLSSRIISESILTYNEPKNITGLDLVYWDYIKDMFPESGSFQNVTVSGAVPIPVAGAPGDIHFRNIVGGTEIYQKEDPETWTLAGTISGGSSSNKKKVLLSSDQILTVSWSAQDITDFGDIPDVALWQFTGGVYKSQEPAIDLSVNGSNVATTFTIRLDGIQSIIVIS